MKILYHHRIASKDGQYVHVKELTNALKNNGNVLLFVSPGFTKNTDFGDDGGISTKLKKLLPKSIYEILELSYSLIIGIKLIINIIKFKPDFIYERYNLYQPAGVIISKIFRIPLLLEVNAPLVFERQKYSGLALPIIATFIEKFTWRQASAVLPVSNVLANIIDKSGVPRSRINVIHNGINKDLFENYFHNLNKHTGDEIIIGFVGFLNKWHRLDLVIDAISKFPKKNIKLICVGDGDIKNELEKLVSNKGISDKVKFTGHISRNEVFKYVQSFDIALQPSVTPYASPLKLFEYMAAGCLIIAPKSDNICEILDEGNAVLFDLDSPDDFTEKLENSIDHFNDNYIKRVNAKKAITNKKFTWQDNALKVESIAKKLIKND